MKQSGPELLCAGSFLIIALISLAVIGLFGLSASSWFSLEDYMFPEFYPFHPGFQWCLNALNGKQMNSILKSILNCIATCYFQYLYIKALAMLRGIPQTLP